MTHCQRTFWAAAVLLLVMTVSAAAQWPADPAVNLPLADGERTQVVPHCAASADGCCWFGWYDSPGYAEYQVVLQRLDADGSASFPHNGLVISAHPSDTWVMDWALLADRDGNAIVAFADIRAGDFDLYLYKIDQAGNFLWGADGVAITSNGQFFGFPSLAEAANGDIVVVWPEGSMNTVIMMQRLTPAGAKLLGDDALQVAGKSGKMAYAAKVIPADGDNVIVAWSPDYSMDADRQISAQKYDPAGSPVWSVEVPVFDEGMMPMGSYFSLVSDGADGAVLAWASAGDFNFDCLVQHLTTDGAELFAHNGLDAFPGSTWEHLYPDLSFDAASGEMWLFTRAQDTSQYNWGLYGQKLAADGSLLWGTGGKEMLPVDRTWTSLPRAVVTPGVGATFLAIIGQSYPQDEDQLVAGRVDAAGDFVWSGETVTMATTFSDKLNLWAIPAPDGGAVAIWEDRLNDAGDILAQNINADGTLGEPASPVFDAPAAVAANLQAAPNPFNPGTTLHFENARTQPVRLDIYSIDGRRVRTLVDGVCSDGLQSAFWNGRDDGGRVMPAGNYLARVRMGEVQESRGLVLVK